MARILDTIPAAAELPPKITFADLVPLLPDSIPYEYNVYVGGDLAKYGATSRTIIFLMENRIEPIAEVMGYFNDLVSPTGLAGTVTNNLYNPESPAIRLYSNGRLIIDRQTLAFTELPTPIQQRPEVTIEDVISKLPAEIPFAETIYLTGSVALNGWSANDVDFLVGDANVSKGAVQFNGMQDRERLDEVRQYFSQSIGWKVHAGRKIMHEREPVVLLKVYENGLLCLPLR
jgi:hypothetical protein